MEQKAVSQHLSDAGWLKPGSEAGQFHPSIGAFMEADFGNEDQS
jgi:hypothetical protein